MKEATDKMLTYLLIHEKDFIDRDIYLYGLEVFLLNSINILSIVLLGWISNTLLDASIFLITFIIIRQLTGGFHFINYSKCIISFIGVYLVFLLLNSNTKLKTYSSHEAIYTNAYTAQLSQTY